MLFLLKKCIIYKKKKILKQIKIKGKNNMRENLISSIVAFLDYDVGISFSAI